MSVTTEAIRYRHLLCPDCARLVTARLADPITAAKAAILGRNHAPATLSCDLAAWCCNCGDFTEEAVPYLANPMLFDCEGGHPPIFAVALGVA